MARDEISPVALGNDIQHVIQSRTDIDPESLASEIARELLDKYEIRRRPSKPKSYEDKPRGGRIW